ASAPLRPDGGVVTQRTANPCTPVRFRLGPPNACTKAVDAMTAAPATGLERILLDNQARLVRFLAARGAGDEAEDVFQELWQKIIAAPDKPVSQPLSYLFRAA